MAAPPRPDLPPVESIRARFPSLARTQDGMPVAYFDGPGGTQVPTGVIEAIADYLIHHNANTHWAYPSSAETDAAIDAGRRAQADLLGCAPDEIAFGPNMTTLTFHLARALGRRWNPGDEVVVTELDHHANVAPWRALERDRGITVRRAKMEVATGRIDADDLAACMTTRTRLLAIGGAANAIGTINDLSMAAELARRSGALMFVDAVHLAAHAPIDVASIGCDMLACSSYKIYGPHLGVAYVRRDLIEDLDVPKVEPAPNGAPERLETGTLNHEGIAGATAAVEFLAGLAEGVARRERLTRSLSILHERLGILFARLWDGLAAVPGVRMYGPPPGSPRTPTLGFTVDGAQSRDVAGYLSGGHGLFLSHGDFYAATVVDRLGARPQGGLVRAGLACYTSLEEVERLIRGVRDVAAGRAGSIADAAAASAGDQRGAVDNGDRAYPQADARHPR